MTNIVIYARYSSEKQTEQSIEGQLRVCHEYAERNGYNIVHEYIDRALTAKNDKRPAFQQMIKDANKKEFEYILVYKLDRFARIKYDNVIYKHMLELNGIKVISATELISNTPEGNLMEGLLELFAEMYLKDLSQKVKRGMRESMIKGNYLGGNILYGYKVVDKKIFIDEDKAPAIRYLFNEYANGKPRNQIVDELNNKGYRTNRGKPFSYNSLQTTLSNIKYIGRFDNGEVQNDNYYPPIIDQELFDKVQLRLKLNRNHPTNTKTTHEYLLSGKAFCGYCGNSLVGVSGTAKSGNSHHYYSCSKRWKSHDCKKKNERQVPLENIVIKKIKHILNPKTIDFIATKVYEQYNCDKTDTMLKDYEVQLIRIEKELDKCFEIFYNANNIDLRNRMNEKADSLSLQKQDLQAEINKIEQIRKMQHSKQDIIEILNFFVDGDENDIDYKKRIIDNFVSAIYVFDDHLMIYFTLFDKTLIPFDKLKEDLEELGVRISSDTVHQSELS